MLKKLAVSAFALALTGAALLQPAHAGAILTKNFFGTQNGVEQLVASISVDTDKSNLWVDSVYQATTWSSFTFFGQEVNKNDVSGFIAEFDLNDIFAGFTFLQFDLRDSLRGFNFQVFISDIDGVFAADVYDRATNSNLFPDGVSVSNTSVVSAPATTALLLMGFAGLMLRRQQQK